MRFSVRKRTCLFFFLLFFSFVIALANAEGANLIYNGDFELPDDPDSSLPAGWETEEYFENSDYSTFRIIWDDLSDRGYVAFIQNHNLNDARYVQYVDVEPDTVYRLSGYIKAEGVISGRGANLSIGGLYAFSESVYDTKGEWQYVEYYGETGPYQTSLNVYVRLGGYGGESIGRVYFDDIWLEAVDEIPDDIIAARWYTVDDYDDEDYDDYNYGDDADFDDTADTEEQKDPSVPMWLKLTCIFICWTAALYTVIYYYRDGRKARGYLFYRSNPLPCLPFLILALIFRMIISYMVEGYQVDVNCFTAWGQTMARVGPTQFYQKSGFCDYPPLYTYVLGASSRLSSDLYSSGFWEFLCEKLPSMADITKWTNVIFRFFPSLCDVGFCYILYRYAYKRYPEKRHYLSVMLIMIAMNPAMILNSAGWGQVDSVLGIMLVMVVLLAIEKKWHIAIPVYAMSVLVKPQALMLGFLGLAYMIISFVKEPEYRKLILKGIGIGVALMIAMIIPFGLSQDYGWLIKLYEKTLFESYPYATVNCANIYYLLGGNWDSIENCAHVIIPVFLFAVSIVYAFLWYHFNQHRKCAWIETFISLLFSCWCIYLLMTPYHTWGEVGVGAMAFPFLITISLAVRKGDVRFLPYLGGLLFILLYVFGVKMHERYLFPGLFLLFTGWVVLQDRRILHISLLFTLTLFVNEGMILDNSIRLGSEYGHLWPDTVRIADAVIVIPDIVCVVNIIGAILAVLLGFSILAGHEPGKIRPIPTLLPLLKRKNRGRTPLDYHPDRKLHWNWKDTIILCAITVVYSLITLTTLGSTKAPQSVWKSSASVESIIFDLGEDRQDVRILYFGQVNDSRISISQRKDHADWSPDVSVQLREGQCWKWQYISYRFNCRYIRLTAADPGITLNELIFRDDSGNLIPVKIIAHGGGADGVKLYYGILLPVKTVFHEEGIDGDVLYSNPENLLDEQDTLEALPSYLASEYTEDPAQPSWWNSTYFDEIYHARTGFEFLNPSMRPYEWTHPPLGKVLISWAVSIFGMTPFGWRFAGALAGILMLPGMYLLGKQLTKKTSIAAMICLLMALDCMHLTQTQIATIDSYPVLFIIFAYFFMLRFIQTDVLREPLRHSLCPLFFSGLFIGFAIASKWIGIYAAAGLAVLFFWHCLRTMRLYREARGMYALGGGSKEERESLHRFIRRRYPSVNPLWNRLWIICLCCVFFFIVLPLTVYLLSYLPFMRYYSEKIHTLDDYFNMVWKEQLNMYAYHSKPRLGMDHPYYSPWYEWPFIGKPMWYANEQYTTAGSDIHYSIFSFGNPVIWWGALLMLPVCLIRWIGQKRYQINDLQERWHVTSLTYNNSIAFLIIGLMAQFFPWVPVPRGTYIYHYFASVPFLILAFGLSFTGYRDRSRENEIPLINRLCSDFITWFNRQHWAIRLILNVFGYVIEILICILVFPRGEIMLILLYAGICAFAAGYYGKTIRWILAILICMDAFMHFIIFLPYASGLPASKTWMNIGKSILLVHY